MDIDDISPYVVRTDLPEIEHLRGLFGAELLEDLIWLYWRLDTWMQRACVVDLLGDFEEPELFAPVMLDMLRAPVDYADTISDDYVQIALDRALSFVYQRYEGPYYGGEALRAAVEDMRLERALVADDMKGTATAPYASDPVVRLEQACTRGDTDTVLTVLDTGLDVDTPLSVSTPMMHAAVHGHAHTALRLVERGASVRTRWRPTGTTVLIQAGARGSVELIDAVLARGAAPDETDDHGLTALYYASSCGMVDAVRRLLQAGANVHVPQRSPFVAAAGQGHVTVAHALMGAGCGVEEVTFGRTALVGAAVLAHTTALDFLIGVRADVNTRDHDGLTPLMHAARLGSLRSVHRLLRAGADPSATVPRGADAGRSALDMILPYGRHKSAIAELLNNSPKPDPKPDPEPKRGKRPWKGEPLGFEFFKDEGRAHRGAWPCAADCSGTTRLLVAIALRGVPHRAPGHNVMYDYSFLAECTTCRTGRLESYSHDCWNDHEEEPWDLAWVRTVAPAQVERLRMALCDCPEQENYQCGCPAHAALRDSQDRLGEATTAVVEYVDGLPRFMPG